MVLTLARIGQGYIKKHSETSEEQREREQLVFPAPEPRQSIQDRSHLVPDLINAKGHEG